VSASLEPTDCLVDGVPELESGARPPFRRLGEAISNDLWERIVDALPAKSSTRGRERLPDRLVFTTILDILETGTPWKEYSAPGVSGVTCWRRFREWRENGTWRRAMLLLLNHHARIEVREWLLAVVHDPRTQ